MQQRGAGAREADDVQWPGDFHIGQGRIFGKRRLGVETVGEQPQHRAIHHEQATRIELRFVTQRFQENFKRLTKGRAAEVRQARLPLHLVEQGVRVEGGGSIGHVTGSLRGNPRGRSRWR